MTDDRSTLRWGIVSTGRIADEFAADLALASGHRLEAVASRDRRSADIFAATHGGARAHGRYEDLFADPDVDVVYVGTPHHRHADDVAAAIDAGKAVLCEKPLTLDAATAEELVALARARGVFLAEAMWMRANPAIRRAVEMAHDGSVGRPTSVRADLGFVAPRDKARLWDPALGASALLDVGIYPFTLAHLVLGEPTSISAAGVLDDSGSFDLAGGATLTYADGAVASLSWGQNGMTDSRASIAGDAGLIEVGSQFHHPDGFTWTDGTTERAVDLPRTGLGFVHEIVEVGDCLAAGRTESDLLPLDDTLVVLRQLDTGRAQLLP